MALFKSFGQEFNSFNQFKDYIYANCVNHAFVFYKKNYEKNNYKIFKFPKIISRFKLNF